METSVESIALRAREHTEEKFTALMHHFSEENLRSCFDSLKGNKAVGVDGITKDNYQEKLDENLKNLVKSLKQMSYKPRPVRRVEIPKEDGNVRPLGISCTEDKIIQEMTRRILEAIYEPVFMETSYGFRRGRNCHDALRRLNLEIMTKPVNWVVDLDISQFFDAMPHDKILEILQERIGDRKLLRLIVRMLKAGVQTPSDVLYDELGSPQGSVVSPIIANIFLHKVIDQWFNEVLKSYFVGYCEIIRYADDVVAVFEGEDDARKFMKVLPLRLAKFGLKLNETKTRMVPFGKRLAHQSHKQGKHMETFDFVGFTHYWGKSLNGKSRVKRKTSKKRLRRALKTLNKWIGQERHSLCQTDKWQILASKIRGHFNYFGVSDNMPSLEKFKGRLCRILIRWLNRRSQRRSFKWDKFNEYLKRYPLPKPCIKVNLNPVW